MNFYWPDNEPIIHAKVVEITEPFNIPINSPLPPGIGSIVEIKLSMPLREDIKSGSVYLCVSPEYAAHWNIGDVYVAHLRRVSTGGSPVINDCENPA